MKQRHAKYLLAIILTGILHGAVAAQVQPSTPTVVYAIPETRWEFQLLRTIYMPSQDTLTVGFPSLAYFYKSHRAIGLEGSFLESRTLSRNMESVHMDSQYLAVTHLWEKPIGNQLRPYFKAGPAAYRFRAYDNFTSTTDGVTIGGQEETKWSPGLLAEAGVTIGWSRGFVFTLGYGLNAFYQPSLLGAIDSSVRAVHGARASLGYRW